MPFHPLLCLHVFQISIPSSQRTAASSNRFPWVCIPCASGTVLVSGPLLLGWLAYSYSPLQAQGGLLRKASDPSWVICCLQVASFPQAACFQYSAPLLDLKYIITTSLTLTKFSNLYLFYSFLKGISLSFQSGPITIAKQVHNLDQLIIFISTCWSSNLCSSSIPFKTQPKVLGAIFLDHPSPKHK